MYPFLFSVRVLFNPKSLITVTAWNFSGTWSCDAFSFDSCTDHSSRVDCFQSQKNHAYRSHIMSGVTCNLPLRVHSTRLINVGSAWKRKSRNPSYSLKWSVKLNHTSQEKVCFGSNLPWKRVAHAPGKELSQNVMCRVSTSLNLPSLNQNKHHVDQLRLEWHVPI